MNQGENVGGLPLLALALTILVIWLLWEVPRLLRRKKLGQYHHEAKPSSSPEIDRMLAQLAAKGWPTRDETASMVFEFQIMNAANDFETFVADLLKHIRRVAPNLNVPFKIPRVDVEGLNDAAGQFIEQDGWVKISVSSGFINDRPLARSILCHEVCHYVLNASGIRVASTAENERLTDVAMFALGLGGIFMEGYRGSLRADYRKGHKLGYLNESEYGYARERAFELWRSGQVTVTELAKFQVQFKAAIPDAGVRQRLLGKAREAAPTASDAELIKRVLDSYRADRR